MKVNIDVSILLSQNFLQLVDNLIRHTRFVSVYTTMGPYRNGLIEQSKIKRNQKLPRTKKRGESQWWRFDGPNYYENKNSLFLSEDFVGAKRRMSPQEVANILLSQRKCKQRNCYANSDGCFPEHEIS